MAFRSHVPSRSTPGSSSCPDQRHSSCRDQPDGSDTRSSDRPRGQFQWASLVDLRVGRSRAYSELDEIRERIRVHGFRGVASGAWLQGREFRVHGSRGVAPGFMASVLEQGSGIEELKGGKDGPNSLEARIASPESSGRVDSSNGDLDIGQRDGLVALSQTCSRLAHLLPLGRPQVRPRQAGQQQPEPPSVGRRCAGQQPRHDWATHQDLPCNEEIIQSSGLRFFASPQILDPNRRVGQNRHVVRSAARRCRETSSISIVPATCRSWSTESCVR